MYVGGARTFFGFGLPFSGGGFTFFFLNGLIEGAGDWVVRRAAVLVLGAGEAAVPGFFVGVPTLVIPSPVLISRCDLTLLQYLHSQRPVPGGEQR